MQLFENGIRLGVETSGHRSGHMARKFYGKRLRFTLSFVVKFSNESYDGGTTQRCDLKSTLLYFKIPPETLGENCQLRQNAISN